MGQIAVIGAAGATEEEYRMAIAVGRLIAEEHEILVCGGHGGVMEAACRGAHESGGLAVGIVPDIGNGNGYLGIVIRTGLGHSRNVLVAQSADAVIAVGGSYGTLSEIAVALKWEIPVFGLKTWDIPGVIACISPEDAVTRAVAAARQSRLYIAPREGSGAH